MLETEFLLTTNKSTQQQISARLLNYKSSNTLQFYKKGGIAAPKTLDQIGDDYIVTGEESKPLIHVWPVNSEDQLKNARLVLPGPADVLAICPDNVYLTVGVGTKIYVWQLCSGKLLTVQEKHLLKITCLKFSSDTDYLITASENGTVIVYNFGALIDLGTNQYTQSKIGQVEPLYCIMDHVKAVTDIHVGKLGCKSRFVTVSLDKTCRIYDLLKGHLLLNIICSAPLTATALEVSCWNLFAGTSTGLIQQFRLLDPPKASTLHESTVDEKLLLFGHKERINCLDLNLTNELLVSGSDDGNVIVWNVFSREKINTIDLKGPIVNARFVMGHANFVTHNFKASHVIKDLQRTVDFDLKDFTVSIIQERDIEFDEADEEHVKNDRMDEKIAALNAELKKYKISNKELFKMANRVSTK